MDCHLDVVITPLLLILPKMSGHVKIFRNKSKDKKKNNGLVCFCIDNNKLLEKYKTIWTKTKDLQNIELFTKLK